MATDDKTMKTVEGTGKVRAARSEFTIAELAKAAPGLGELKPSAKPEDKKVKAIDAMKFLDAQIEKAKANGCTVTDVFNYLTDININISLSALKKYWNLKTEKPRKKAVKGRKVTTVRVTEKPAAS